jgi:two-component system phosphate regulon response regulator PhoB
MQHDHVALVWTLQFGSSMSSDILLVQPDPEQSTMIRSVLEANGYTVSEAPSVDALGSNARLKSPAAILVHWSSSVATSEFLDVAARRNSHGACAIVMARESELSDALAALEIGYDDCIRIPANKTELLARLRASLKRRQGLTGDKLALGPLLLNRKAHCLFVNGKPVALAPTEYRLLDLFMQNPGRVMSRDEILKGAWHRDITTGSRTVDVHVRRLRQILEPYGCDRMIQTVRSFGYRFREAADET